MSDAAEIGKIGWIDMTAEDAPAVRDFYKAVVGWEADEIDMGGYSDYVMKMPASGNGVSGVCHARGSNADLPSGWLIYIIVANVVHSIEQCKANGGKVVVEPRGLAGGCFCVVEDPGGSVAGLYQPEAD
jgi:predicted enzyme related to lactoylglutathione lyase